MRGKSGNPLTALRTRFKKLGPMAPRFSIGLRLDSGQTGGNFFSLPFRRSPLLILVSFGFLAAFSIPYFTMGGFLAGPEDDSLFSLVFLLFSLFWLLGWSVGVFVLLAVFLLISFGKEVLQIRPGWMKIRIEVLRLGIGMEFRAEGIENLRLVPAVMEQEDQDSGLAWRADHMAFDYGGETFRFGSAIDQALATRISGRISELAVAQSPGISLVETRPSSADSVPSATQSAAISRPGRAGRLKDPGLQATSTRILVLANLIPLFGVLLDDWSIGDIMLLFWAESAIIGFFNLLKMWVIGRWSILFLGPFFTGHFGGFMVGHLLFIYALFLSGPDSMDPSVSQVFSDFTALWPALLGLAISHGISFSQNFLGRQEYLVTTVNEQMGAPYKRIIIMHMTIIFGGFLTMAFETPLLALLLLIVLKIAVDVKSHISERRAGSRPPADAAAAS
ncbi:MAG: hypothetical protein KJN90_03215 [Gammaproteobacteria bacterium]|nr:hypothetical protein [Gammaproteobacteria bacterium]